MLSSYLVSTNKDKIFEIQLSLAVEQISGQRSIPREEVGTQNPTRQSYFTR